MVSELHKQVALAVRAGHDLDEIEHNVIEPSILPEDEKAALWLYAQVLSERPRIARAGPRQLAPRAEG